MRILLSCATLFCALSVSTGSAQMPLPSASAGTSSSASSNSAGSALRKLGIEEAWALAEASSPQLGSKQAQLEAIQGLQTDANALFYNNPTVSLEGTARRIPSAESPANRQREWTAGVSQAFEIAGQRGHRQDAANAGLIALRAEIEDVRRQIRAEVTQRFYRVLSLQQREDVEAQALSLFGSTAAAMQKRRAAGEDTRLDANVALVEAERARNQLAQVREQLIEARSELAAALQLPAESVPLASGDLVLQTPAFTLDRLLESARSQPRLRALSAQTDGAAARLKLERAAAYPDITVGMAVAREGATNAREKVTTLSISLPLPMFRRNAAGIGQASSELTQLQIEQQAAVRNADAQVRALWLKLQSVEARVRRLQDSVLPALESNQSLAGKSQRAGEIGLLEMIVVSRQTLDARRDLLEAQTEYFSTRVALEQAAGWQP